MKPPTRTPRPAPVPVRRLNPNTAPFRYHQKKPRGGCWISAGIAVIFWALLLWAGSRPISRISEGVRKKEASVMAAALAHAVSQFHADYGKLPELPGAFALQGSDVQADTSSGHILIRILAGKEPATGARQNPREVNYLEGIKPAKGLPKPGPHGDWINGLVCMPPDFSVIDPWGLPFRVRLDTNGDGMLANPVPESPPLAAKALFWSAGKDGDWDTWDDNPRSWN